MGRYAEGTKVPAERSRVELQRVLERYGCEGFMYGSSLTQGEMVQFGFEGRQFRFEINPPDDDPKEVRRMWRVLVLWVKGSLEAVDAGYGNVADAFMSRTVMPNGRLLGDEIGPTLDALVDKGRMPNFKFLLGNGS